jgi:methyltransferase family protein
LLRGVLVPPRDLNSTASTESQNLTATPVELTVESLRDAIISAGSDSADFFGFPEIEDGLHLQQNPQEYAEFVHFMATSVPPSKLAIDIGIASGGQTKFLRDYYRIDKSIIVDIGDHNKFHHWSRIRKLMNTEIVLEVIADSHSERVRNALLPYAGKVDFAFIDGDHSYRGLKQDLILAKAIAVPGATFALHDTTAVKDCARVFAEMKCSPDFELLGNFSHRFGISVWRYLAVKRNHKQSLWSRLTGNLEI